MSSTSHKSTSKEDKLDVNFWKVFLKDTEEHQLLRGIIEGEENDQDDDVILPFEQEEEVKRELMRIKGERMSLIMEERDNRRGSSTGSQDLQSGGVSNSHPKSYGGKGNQENRENSQSMSRSTNARNDDANESSTNDILTNRSIASEENPFRSMNRTNTVVSVVSKAPQTKDIEKQQLRYKVAKLQREYRNSRVREMKAVETAQTLQDLLMRQIQCNKNLKKSLCEKEIEIVQMREVVDELNGALQRANMSEQHKKANRGLSDKLAENLDVIHTSINDKRALINLIEQQKQELNQYSKIIRSLTRSLKTSYTKASTSPTISPRESLAEYDGASPN